MRFLDDLSAFPQDFVERDFGSAKAEFQKAFRKRTYVFANNDKQDKNHHRPREMADDRGSELQPIHLTPILVMERGG
jgi:hypothetical protein